MSDLSELADLLGRQKKDATVRKFTASDTVPHSKFVGPEVPADFVPPKQVVANPNAQPGDPDFNWDNYWQWKNTRPDEFGQAKMLAEKFNQEDRATDRKFHQEANKMQAEKFASGEIESGDRSLPRSIAEFEKESYKRALEPGPLAMIGATLAPELLPVSGLLGTAAAIGGGAAAGDFTGNLTSGSQTGSLTGDLEHAGETGVATGLSALLTGGAAKAGKSLGGKTLDVASHVPVVGKYARAAKTAMNLGKILGIGSEEAAATAPAGVETSQDLAARMAPRRSVSTEIPYASRQQAVNPNQVLATARDIAAENGEPVVDALRSGSKAYPREQRNAIEGLLQAGEKVRGARAAHTAAEAENVGRHAAYGNGGVMPEGQTPTELRDPALEALRKIVDTPNENSIYPGIDLQDLEYLGGEAEPVGGFTTLPPRSRYGVR